jgi:hypothetical protein
LKCSNVSSGFAMSLGREFHTAGPETRKLLGPKRCVLVWGVMRYPRATERRCNILFICWIGTWKLEAYLHYFKFICQHDVKKLLHAAMLWLDLSHLVKIISIVFLFWSQPSLLWKWKKRFDRDYNLTLCNSVT